MRIHFFNKTQYLNVQFANPSRIIDIAQIRVSKGAKLKGFLTDDITGSSIINDKDAIQKTINYLNNIPLLAVSKKEWSEDLMRCSISFYDGSGMELGWIFCGEEYLLWSVNMTVYKVKDEEKLLVSGLVDLLEE